jgi:acyl-CoA synthetase (AMP-forming)/AMP-acid ligase II
MIIVPNSVDFVEIMHSVLWFGGVACPVNHALVVGETAHAITVARPFAIIVCGSERRKVLKAVELAEKELQGRHLNWTRPCIVTAIQRVDGLKHFPEDFLVATALPIPHHQDSSDRVATIHLSSGTTGKPKGVELTHYNYVANCFQLYHHDPAQWPPGLRQVAYTPYVHIAQTMPVAFFGPWIGMMYQAMSKYDLQTYARLNESNQCTNHLLLPTVAIALLSSDVMQKYDFSKSKTFTAGQLSMTERQISDLVKKAPWQMMRLYGMTEASPYIAYSRIGEALPHGAIGPLLPGLEVMLKLPNGDDAPEGGPGELWVRGPNITRGYVFNDAATKSAFPLENWYNSGDLCTISKEGWLSVVGRTKELIKYKGFQISPEELEVHLGPHPLVADGAIGAVFDSVQLTEVPTAYVVLAVTNATQEERKRALQDIHAAVDKQVSGYKRLRGGVWEVTELPRNASGKFVRRDLHKSKTGLCSLNDGQHLAKL